MKQSVSHSMPRPVTRRDALRVMGAGFGLVGLGGAMRNSAQAANIGAEMSPLAPKPPHFPAKAKHIIYLFLSGGLSQVDSFDYKPMLDKYDGKPMPYDKPETQFITGNLMKSPFHFKQYGQNGTWVSDLFPNVGEIIDEFCVLRSTYTDIPNPRRRS
jgi:hypothetical protein